MEFSSLVSLVEKFPVIFGSAVGWYVVEHLLAPLFFHSRIFLSSEMRSVYGKLEKKKQIDCQERFTSMIFTVSVTFSAVYILLTDDSLWEDKIWGRNKFAEYLLLTTIGYFLWDIQLCLTRFSSHGGSFLFHAVACCCAYSFLFLVPGKVFIEFFGMTFLCWEASTPFLNMISYLSYFGHKESLLAKINGTMFTFMFFLSRMVAGYYFSYLIWDLLLINPSENTLQTVPYFYRLFYPIINISLNLLNAFWFTKIFAGFLKAVAGVQKSNKQA